MPVSHIGLTVSHLPWAASFYLATLQHLGYHFIGQSGNSIGLGIDQPDLFLTQEPQGKAVSPAHIAFRADSRLEVRNCYASALQAGAHPSGAPSYRNGECTVFNAAVFDLDGNVVEFVYQEGGHAEEEEPDAASEVSNSRVLTWQKDVAASDPQDDAHSVDSRVSRARSRAETVKTLMSTASRSVRSVSAAPAPRVRRAVTAPVATSNAEFPTKAFFGTILGMAAGATIAWAMMKAEHDDEKAEQAFTASLRSRGSTKAPTEEQTAARSRHNFSTTDSHISRRFPPRSMARTMRAIQPTAHNDDDAVDKALSRFTPVRPSPTRSRTSDAIGYAPISQAGRTSTSTIRRVATLPVEDQSRYLLEAPKPASVESHHNSRAPEADDSAESRVSRRSGQRSSAERRDRRSSVSRRRKRDADDTDMKPTTTISHRSDRRTSVQDDGEGSTRSRNSDRHRSMQRERERSTASRRTEPRPITEDESPKGILSRLARRPESDISRLSDHRCFEEDAPKKDPSRYPAAEKAQGSSPRHGSHRSAYEGTQDDLKRRDSGVSMHSHRSHRSRRSTRDRDSDSHSSGSTIKASRQPSRYQSASRPASHVSAKEIPLPDSRRSSLANTPISASQTPLPESHANGWDDPSEESDGLGDLKTVVPDDSISCVDFGKPSPTRRSSQTHRSERRAERRSEAGGQRTTRPARKREGGSAATVPMRGRREGLNEQ